MKKNPNFFCDNATLKGGFSRFPRSARNFLKGEATVLLCQVGDNIDERLRGSSNHAAELSSEQCNCKGQEICGVCQCQVGCPIAGDF